MAVYVAQVGSLAMIAIGPCYLVLARDGAMTSVTSREQITPALCAGGILAEFVAGVAGYSLLQQLGQLLLPDHGRKGELRTSVASGNCCAAQVTMLTLGLNVERRERFSCSDLRPRDSVPLSGSAAQKALM